MPPSNPRPPTSSLRSVLAGFLPLVVFFHIVSFAFAAEPRSKRIVFDIPSGVARESLKQFAEQSGTQLLYAVEVVDGVKTNAVKGEWSPREAIDRMLAGTQLAARQTDNGAIAVRLDRGSEKKVPAPAQVAAGDRQAKAPASRTKDPGSPSSSEEEKAIELSPFVVNADQDNGYQVRSTMAGTRLNTPLEDIGAAISVYNSEFLSDIGATDHNELLIYATGMEASGAQGNMSGLTANVNNTGTSTTREDPEGGAGFGVAIRTRGLSVPSRTRGFFTTDIPSDSYNLERVTVNRGPNSILFGIGNPGGIIDSSLLRANLSRNQNKVQFRYGDNDSIRTSVDFNRALIKKALAVRLAALHHREEYDQRPAFEEKRRLYGAVTYQPFASTAIRANFETGRGLANRVYTVPPQNSFAVWEQEGRQAFDWTFYDDPARNPSARTQNVQNYVPLPLLPSPYGDRVLMVYADPSGAGTPTAFSNRIRLVAPNGNAFHPVYNRDSGLDNYQFVATRNISQMPGAWWPGGSAPPATRAVTFSDYSAFPWNKQQLYTSDRQQSTFNTFNIAIEQRAWKDRIGIELAYDRQRFHLRYLTVGYESQAVNVDANLFLPTGERNPNLGRPYMRSNGVREMYNYSYREGRRVTAYLNYDFKDMGPPWARWLGRHNVTFLAEKNARDFNRGGTDFSMDGPAALQAGDNILVSARANLNSITYVGPSLFGNNTPARFDQVNTPLPAPGISFPTTYYDPAAGGLATSQSTLVELVRQGSANRDVVKSLGVAMQSYWLRDHLVTLVGWRRDRDFFDQQSLTAKRNTTRTGPNDPGTVRWNKSEFGFAGTPPLRDGDEIVSYSAVLKWPARLIPLPAGLTPSMFYTESDSFAPTGSRVDTVGRPLPPPTGETKEYGVNLSALDGKLSVRVGQFKTSIVKQPIVSGGLPTDIAVSGVTQTVGQWMEEGNRNPGNVAFMNLAIQKMLSPLPADFLDFRSFTVSGTPPNIDTSYNSFPQASDTTDFVAKGTELGIVYNPTRNWRIMANVTRSETVQANLYPVTKAFLELMAPVFNSTITDPVSGVTVPFRDIPKGGYPEGFGPANPPAANTQRFGEYLDNRVVFPLAAFRATEGFASPEQRKWRANFVTNYEFSGDSPFGSRLKGWGVGMGYRWQSKIAMGYPSFIDENGVARFEIDKPYWGPEETNVDAWVTYGRRILKDRVKWKVQFNVKNLIGGTDLIPVRAQPWGEVAVYRIPPEKRWYLTNTFEF